MNTGKVIRGCVYWLGVVYEPIESQGVDNVKRNAF